MQRKQEIESTINTMSAQYRDLTDRINVLKSKKDLTLIEEVELLNLMAQAQGIAIRLENKYGELEDILRELRKSNILPQGERKETLTLKITNPAHFEGPAEIQERIIILKDKEQRLLKEIQRLEQIEKKRILKEESQAFMKEQSLFDEDSVIAVVKKSVKDVSESSERISSVVEDRSLSGGAYNNNAEISTSTTTSPVSSQEVKIRVEVSYEKSGFINQADVSKNRIIQIEIDPANMSQEELRDKINQLKSIYNEVKNRRVELEMKAQELERLFKRQGR